MSKLLILGAGGLASCALDIAMAMNEFDTIAFLDDHKKEVCGCKVLGKLSQLESFYPEYDAVCIAIGDHQVRSRVHKQVIEIGYRFATLKHPSAIISNFAKIGEGNIIFPNVVIEANAQVGIGNIICANTVLQHDTTLANFSLLYANTTIKAYSTIQSYVRIGANCCVQFHHIVQESTIYDDGLVIGKEE